LGPKEKNLDSERGGEREEGKNPIEFEKLVNQQEKKKWLGKKLLPIRLRCGDVEIAPKYTG
jgi:hypothetical protein